MHVQWTMHMQRKMISGITQSDLLADHSQIMNDITVSALPTYNGNSIGSDILLKRSIHKQERKKDLYGW